MKPVSITWKFWNIFKHWTFYQLCFRHPSSLVPCQQFQTVPPWKTSYGRPCIRHMLHSLIYCVGHWTDSEGQMWSFDREIMPAAQHSFIFLPQSILYIKGGLICICQLQHNRCCSVRVRIVHFRKGQARWIILTGYMVDSCYGDFLKRRKSRRDQSIKFSFSKSYQLEMLEPDGLRLRCEAINSVHSRDVDMTQAATSSIFSKIKGFYYLPNKYFVNWECSPKPNETDNSAVATGWKE